MSELTHLDEHGRARMVDVSAKEITKRKAVARGVLCMLPETLERILEGSVAKGDVLAAARIAGVMAAKRTSDLIPLCHPLSLDAVHVDFHRESRDRLVIEAAVTVTARTGAEMEALTAVAVAGLTVYDMCKAVDRAMQLSEICLVQKSGGRSGEWTRAVREI